jgi:voltage-gated potassium channel
MRLGDLKAAALLVNDPASRQTPRHPPGMVSRAAAVLAVELLSSSAREDAGPNRRRQAGLGTGELMTADSYQYLPPAQRRRLIARATLRGVLTTAVLVVLYYELPLDQPFGTSAVVHVLIGLVVFAGVTAWQVRNIIDSRYPGMKAVEVLGVILPFYLLLFASTYFAMERALPGSFTQPLTRTDSLYFTVTVFSTVGFGDITAKSEPARIILIVQMLGDLALLGAGIRVLLGAVRRGQERRSATENAAGPAGSTP